MATAGSGKTTTLVERVRALFKEGATQDEVLALTFTKEAADNLERRLGIKVSKASRGGFRTFHSFCLNLIKQEARFLPYGLSSEPFPAGNGLSKILLESMKAHGIKRKLFEEVRAAISRWKRARLSPQTLFDLDGESEEEFIRAYSTYESRLRDGGMLDFDSMIVEAVNMLEKHSEVRERWQFKWVMADEGQDTDDLQFRLLQLVSEKFKNVYVVGDFCQALYEFRGASPSNLLEFGKWFADAKTIILPENFRSTPEIVAFSRQNAPIKNELTDNIRTANLSSNIPVQFRMYSGPDQEAEAVLSEALKDPGNSAILARTNNQLGLYETLCLQHNIRFHLLGRSGLWNKPEITTLVHLAAFCIGNSQPAKYSETLLNMHRAEIKRLDAYEGLKKVVHYANLENLYSNEDYSEDENFALTNIRTVVDIAKRFRTLQDFLNHARRAAHASRKSKNAVTLGTVHQSKGLEYHNVFVIGVQDKYLPHEKGELSEESRIWYVAITRAAKMLRISWAGTPSRFVEPHLTPEIREQLRIKNQEVEKIQRQLSMF